MTPEDIQARQAAVQAKFDALKSEVESLKEQLNVKNDELLRLQGEYRAYEAMLANEDPLTITAVEDYKSKETK